MDSVYNSPPNWPPPPTGWTPPPGWTPDPSWPEPPQNWQFQVPAPQQPPPRTKRRLWLKIGLPVAAVLLLLGGSITAVVLSVLNAVKPVENAASSYMQALKDQRYDAAFEMHCSAGLGGRDAFVERWSGQSSTGHGITDFKVVGTSLETNNGGTTGKVNLEVRYADGRKQREKMTLIKTGETWSPCS